MYIISSYIPSPSQYSITHKFPPPHTQNSSGDATAISWWYKFSVVLGRNLRFYVANPGNVLVRLLISLTVGVRWALGHVCLALCSWYLCVRDEREPVVVKAAANLTNPPPSPNPWMNGNDRCSRAWSSSGAPTSSPSWSRASPSSSASSSRRQGFGEGRDYRMIDPLASLHAPSHTQAAITPFHRPANSPTPTVPPTTKSAGPTPLHSCRPSWCPSFP